MIQNNRPTTSQHSLYLALNNNCMFTMLFASWYELIGWKWTKKRSYGKFNKQIQHATLSPNVVFASELPNIKVFSLPSHNLQQHHTTYVANTSHASHIPQTASWIPLNLSSFFHVWPLTTQLSQFHLKCNTNTTKIFYCIQTTTLEHTMTSYFYSIVNHLNNISSGLNSWKT